MPSGNPLERILRPRSVAIVGVSKTPGKPGYEVFSNLVSSGFREPVYPVSPKYREVNDVKCYRSVLDVPDDIDLAIVTTPIEVVPKVLKELAVKGVSAVLVISGKRGEPASELTGQVAKELGLKIIGPASLGVFFSASRLNTTLGPSEVPEGSIGLVVESKTLGAAMMALAASEGVGLSSVVGLGEKAGIDEVDVVEFLRDDATTKAVVIHIEEVTRRELFRRAVKDLLKKKGLVILSPSKKIRSILGDRLAKAVPIIGDASQALDIALALASKRPRGKRIFVAGNSGGAVKLCRELMEEAGISLPKPSKKLSEELSQYIPDGGVSDDNPVDMTGDAGDEIFKSVSEVVLASGEADVLLLIYTEIPRLDPMNVAEVIRELHHRYEEPIVAALVGGAKSFKAVMQLRREGIPVYRTIGRAVNVVATLVGQRR